MTEKSMCIITYTIPSLSPTRAHDKCEGGKGQKTGRAWYILSRDGRRWVDTTPLFLYAYNAEKGETSTIIM